METIAKLDMVEAAQLGACLLEAGCGKMGEGGEPPRPWMFLTMDTEAEVRAIWEGFGNLGGIRPKRNGEGWRVFTYGNETLIMCQYLLGNGLRGYHAVYARHLLDKWGKDGKAWDSELERLKAERGL